MKMIKGGTYLIKHNTYSHQGKLLCKGDAVVLRDYDSSAERVMIEFDGSLCWLDPEFLEAIDGDAPIESDDEPSKPAHYDTGIDTIAFLRANCPPEQVEGFLRGNAIKYLQRYASKGTPIEDLKKSRHYIDMLIEELEGRE